jgi:hypothetical protein
MLGFLKVFSRKIGADGRRLSNSDLFERVEYELSKLGCEPKNARIGDMRDSHYRCISVKDMEVLIANYRQKDPQYQLEKFDCDDSGDTFMADIKRGWCDASRCQEALAFGWVWLRLENSKVSHWMIWQIDNDLRIVLWEPQTNLISEEPILEVMAFGS